MIMCLILLKYVYDIDGAPFSVNSNSRPKSIVLPSLSRITVNSTVVQSCPLRNDEKRTRPRSPVIE